MRCHAIYMIFFLLFDTSSLYEARFIKTFNHRLSTRGWKSNHFYGGSNLVNGKGNILSKWVN